MSSFGMNYERRCDFDFFFAGVEEEEDSNVYKTFYDVSLPDYLTLGVH